MELSSPKLKKTSYISGANLQSLKNKQSESALKTFLVSYDVSAVLTAVKYREILYEAKIQHRDITL